MISFAIACVKCEKGSKQMQATLQQLRIIIPAYLQALCQHALCGLQDLRLLTEFRPQTLNQVDKQLHDCAL